MGCLGGFREIIAQGNFVWPGIVVDLDMSLYVSHRRVVHSQDDEIHRSRESVDLGLDPARLIAAGQQRSIAVESEHVDASPQLHWVPAAVSHFGEVAPPVLEGLSWLAGEFMISERGEYAQMRVSPRLRLGLELRIILFGIAAQRHIAIQDHRAGPFRGDLTRQPLPHARVGGPDVRGIREALVAVSDESKRIAKLGIGEPEGRTRLTEQIAGW
jgi:hypothetical protein